MIIPCNSWILEILHFTLKNEKYSFTFKELNDPIKPTTRTKFAVIRGFWPNRGIIQILSHHSISGEHLRTSCTRGLNMALPTSAASQRDCDERRARAVNSHSSEASECVALSEEAREPCCSDPSQSHAAHSHP